MDKCEKRWFDTFITQTDKALDAHYACDVQSVDLHHTSKDFQISTSSPPGWDAIVVDRKTEWILPTWTNDYKTVDGGELWKYRHSGPGGTGENPDYSTFRSIEVGDTIRIGNEAVNGTADYVTVLAKVAVDRVYNGTKGVLPIVQHNRVPDNPYRYPGTSGGVISDYPTDHAGVDYLVANTSGYYGTANSYITVTDSPGIAQYAFRINRRINATALPDMPRFGLSHYNDKSHSAHLALSIDIRNEAYEREIPHNFIKDTAQESHEVAKHPSSFVRYYPMYLVHRYKSGTMIARLDAGVKHVECIKLVGYSIAAKRHVGHNHGHEMSVDDYLVMRIKEVNGKVVSNNDVAHGAFAVLFAGDTSHNKTGGIEFHRFDEQNGIATLPLKPTILRNMTIEMSDKNGNPAHYGRLHLWFKLLASHG